MVSATLAGPRPPATQPVPNQTHHCRACSPASALCLGLCSPRPSHPAHLETFCPFLPHPDVFIPYPPRDHLALQDLEAPLDPMVLT